MLSVLLMAPAERVDVIVDFTDVPLGHEVILLNLGPDEPFGGGTPGVDFNSADSGTTGQVMQFKVIAGANSNSTAPMDLTLSQIELHYGVGGKRAMTRPRELEKKCTRLLILFYGNAIISVVFKLEDM